MKKIIISLLTVLMVFTMVSCSQELYTFKYETNGGTAIDPVLLKDGEKTTAKPTIRDGYAFVDCWYADPECTEPYNFDKPVHKNTTVYAKWDQAFVTVATKYSEEDTTSTGFFFKAEGKWTDLQYSFDGYTWVKYVSGTSVSVPRGTFKDSNAEAKNYAKLLLRGVGNTVIVGKAIYNADADMDNHGGKWIVSTISTATASNVSFTCTGDIRLLLDYKKVKAKEGVTLDEYAFANMFAGCDITLIPYLNGITTYKKGCFENMFYGCQGVDADTNKNDSIATFECTAQNPSVYCKNMFNGDPIKNTGTYYIHYGY